MYDPERINIVLISCTKTKWEQAREEPLLAKDLYAASPWFRAAWALARHTSSSPACIRILSARHGILSPFQKVTYYEQALRTKNQQEKWAMHAWAQWQNYTDWLWQVEPDLARLPHNVYFLAGKRYADLLGLWISRLNYCFVEYPLRGMAGIGNQIKWMRAEAERVKAERYKRIWDNMAQGEWDGEVLGKWASEID